MIKKVFLFLSLTVLLTSCGMMKKKCGCGKAEKTESSSCSAE